MEDKEYQVYIRPIEVSDAELIIKWRNSENVKKYFILQENFTLEGQVKWINNIVNNGKAFQFVIVEKASNRSVGSVYIRNVDQIHKKGEYGIFIGEDDARGKGYGTQAAKLIIKYAFNEKKLHRIYLRVFSDNYRAISSYKKVGFNIEGVLREDVYVRGVYRDITWMAIVNSSDKEV